MGKRIVALYCVMSFLFCICSFRLYFAAQDSKSQLVRLSQSQTKTIELAKTRAVVYDCNMQRLTDCESRTIAAVAPDLRSVSEISEFLTDENSAILKAGAPAAVAVPSSFNCELSTTATVFTRYDGILSHILGYTNGENQGVCGIESSFEDVLSGGTLSAVFQCSASGQILAGKKARIETRYQNQNQKSVVLTVDRQLQQSVETALSMNTEKGAAVVLDNATGEIKAIASTPTFSQSSPQDSLDDKDEPFLNRALCSYSVGSLFKLCVALCAAEQGIDFSYSCTATEMVEGVDFHCTKQHGDISLKKAVALSCNCYFIKLAQRLGAKPILNMADALGFGKKLQLCEDICGDSGILPQERELDDPAALANLSFGQGTLLASPLTLASMLQTIKNGGRRFSPWLISGFADDSGKLIEKRQTPLPTIVCGSDAAQAVCEYMRECVSDGTGEPAAPESGRAGGKTATAEVYGGTAHGWFGGFFESDSGKSHTIVVFCENGGTGAQSAAPIFKIIADEIAAIDRKQK